MVTAARDRADEELSIGKRDSDFDARIDVCVLRYFYNRAAAAVCKQLWLRKPLIHTEAVVTASDW